jgi:hypothetical protein
MRPPFARPACALTLLLALAPGLQAQLPESVAGRWPDIDRRMREMAFAPMLVEPLFGGLRAGTKESVTVPLGAGIPIRIVGICDGDCTDLDLALLTPDGSRIAQDIEMDATPDLRYDPTTGGTYAVEVSMVSCSVEPCVWSLMAYATTTGGTVAAGGPRLERGTLAEGDETLQSGEFVDRYTLTGREGDALVVDLTSTSFDTYLILINPDGTQEDNDDHEGSTTRSLISLDLPAPGEYTVMVTSYAPGEAGAYELLIATDGGGTSAGTGARTERGTLTRDDSSLQSGEYVDEYTFEGRPGQRVTVDVGSSDFDTYLMLLGPNEFRFENDDVPDAPGHSMIDAELTELGTYRVIVTSYAPEETGAYELSIQTGVSTVSAEQRDVQSLERGRSSSGRLEAGDGQIESGEYRDLWVFDGSAGETITVEMSSSGFDSYLGLLSPSGDVLDENDDADGRTDLSRVGLTLRESGRYRVMATSFAAGETGDYSLTLTSGSMPSGEISSTPSAEGSRVFGIFAGISDYGGRASDLSYTADDAVRFADALTEGAGMRRENAVVLTDAQATTDNVRAAFRDIGQRMRPGDRFVFFYSGHGSRVPRAAGPDRSDPDGMDETLSLYDADITDDEMNDLMALVDGGLSLMVLDACFSGGFSKDVISAPGRIGFFSSEEDVTSQVAAKFRAGGYLAVFAADAIGGGYADADGDGAISAIELSQYLHERYRADVKSAGPEDFVRTGGPQSGFQHLVVDRGSIAPFDIIFR